MPLKKEVNENKEPLLEGQVFDLKGETVLDGRVMTLNCIEDCWYYKNISLRSLYDNSPSLTLEFRKDTLPNRCHSGYSIIYNLLFKYMQVTRKRVSKRSVSKVVNCFVKNISRTTFYQTKGLRYNRDKKTWFGNKNQVSNEIFLELISLLEDQGLLSSYSGLYGFKEYKNIRSLLVLSTELINICTGIIGNIPTLMEDCLKHYIPHYVIIRTKIGKLKVERPLVKGEFMKAKRLERAMKEYHEALERHEIKVNGKILHDLYFRSIFTENLDHGGRLSDHGQFQSKTKKERRTLELDGCKTVSLDFKSLHPSVLYAMEGIDLKGFDPYACKVKMKVDLEEVFEYAYDWDLLDCYDCTYDPNRNLAKVALLCMINSDSEDKAIKAVSKEIRDDHRKKDKGNRKFLGMQKPIKVKEVVRELTKSNSRILKYFFTGCGLELQNMDSKMIQYCINSFLLEDKILLPVHDSISIKEEDEQLGMEIMFEAYDEVVGSLVNCRIEKEK